MNRINVIAAVAAVLAAHVILAADIRAGGPNDLTPVASSQMTADAASTTSDAAPAAPVAPAADAAARPGLVVLNFQSAFDGGDMGGRVGYSLRAKLRRSERFAVPDELDIEAADADVAGRPAPREIARAREAAARFGAELVVWGEVTRGPAGGYSISARAARVAGDGPVGRFDESPATLRQVALSCDRLADEAAKEFTGAGYMEVFPSKALDNYARTGGNLVANGDFEKGEASPDNWQRVDGLCSFWDKSDGAHGRVIRVDTDVYLAEWQDWRKRLDAGEPASAAPKKTATSGPRYDTVGGTYGVSLYSDAIAIKPGATYAIEFDARGPRADGFFFPKVFVKGYGEGGASFELYNMYKAARLGGGAWQHFSRVFSPTARTPGVRTMKVTLFAYWPPGEYEFDNVEVYEVRAK